MGTGGRARASLLLLAAVAAIPEALAGERSPDGCSEPRRGPVEIRDEFLVAQPRLTLAARSPDTLGCGRTTVRGSVLASNTFVGAHGTQGAPPDGAPFFDGEGATLDLTWRHGFRADLDVGVRVPLRWRGAGAMDAVAETFHEVLGLDTAGRDEAPRDSFRARGTLPAGGRFEWDDGLDLGRVELEAHWRLLDGGRDALSTALVGRMALPTATGAVGGEGLGAGLQVVGARRLTRAFDAFAGVGATAESDDRTDGVPYERFRGHAFVAIEWRPGPRWSLVLEGSASTSLVRDLGALSRLPFYLRLGAKFDLSPCVRLEAAVVENLINFDASADFGFLLGLSVSV